MNLVTDVRERRAALPTLTGEMPISSVPLPEPMLNGMRCSQDTGLVETYGRRFGWSHQRTFDMRPQGVAEYNGLYITSWYYRPTSPSSPATKLFIVDPVNNISGSVGLVNEVNGVLYPSEGHAGGIAIIGDYLYVADAPILGFHVYDLRNVYPIAGNESKLGTHTAFEEYDYIIPKVGNIDILNTPENVALAYVSISGDGKYFVTGNYWAPNSGYAGTKTYVFKIPIDNTVAEFPAAQVGAECEVIEPILLSGDNVGKPMTAIQGAVITDTDVLIMSRSGGSGLYQLIVQDLLRPSEFFNGNTIGPKNNDYKNWLLGCEDLSFGSNGDILTVTEYYDWRDIASYSLQDVIGLMGVYLPPTIEEHEESLSIMQAELQALKEAVDYYQLQIDTAISEGLNRFDEKTYTV